MSLHTAIAGKLRLLEGIASWQERAHPAKAARMAEYDSWPAAAPAPDVDVRSGTAPGPHGDVPVRIYAPLDRAGVRVRAWCGCTVAGSSAATST